MKVVLIRKLAEQIDGVDVAGCQVGQILDMSNAHAHLLLLEGWAVCERRQRPRAAHSATGEREDA